MRRASITRVNRTELEMLGYTKEEMLWPEYMGFYRRKRIRGSCQSKAGVAKIPLEHPMKNVLTGEKMERTHQF